MRTEDAELIASYLLEGGQTWAAPEPAGVPVAAVTDTLPDQAGSAQLYREHCASCHGREGRGDGWNAVDLRVPPTPHADSALMGQRADDTLFDGIHGGGWVLGKSAHMPAFGDLLTAGQIRALVAHIRELCSCRGPAWSRA